MWGLFWLRSRLTRLLRKVLNRVIYRYVGGNARPVFFDVAATRPELTRIDENYDVIRAELEGILTIRETIPRYHEIDPNQGTISGQGEGAWRTFFVHVHGSTDEFPNRAYCPRTAAIVRDIPGALQAFFSILEPGKSVAAHEGPSMTYLRYHTAFLVPAQNPPKIRVMDQYHTWKERESMLFDDSWEHEVYNESDGVRVVLIVDFMRPMAAPLHALNVLLRWLGRIPQNRWESLYRVIRPASADTA